MDLRKLKERYKQFGGIRLVWQYAKLGVLPVVVKGLLRCVVKRQSFKAIYPEVLKRVEPYLIERFQVSRFKFQASGLTHEHPKMIWWCWLQGLENAPGIVKACYNSLQRHLVQGFKVQGVQGYEIKVINNDNWKEYIELPDYIITKWQKGRIPAALFSDLLRLELLIKYGGTWIDSTVLCTGFQDSCSKFQEHLDADLFLFQYTPPGTAAGISISNWFISAHSNNELLMVLRDMLFAYWKEYNCTLDYYIFHLYFAMVAKEYPEKVAAMPYGSSQRSIALMHSMGKPFNKEKWDKLTETVCFHKLSCRVPDQMKNDKSNYYNHILYGL